SSPTSSFRLFVASNTESTNDPFNSTTTFISTPFNHGATFQPLKPATLPSSTNSTMFFFLSLLSTLFFIPFSLCQPPRSLLIDCGATVTSLIDDRQWLPDTGFISIGTSRTLAETNLSPTLSTVRSFPLLHNNSRRRKFCYVVPVYRTGKYLVRTTYYYGGVNSQVSPPVFDQIVDGTLWSVVNTTEDYARGTASYYEGIFLAAGKSMSVCLASNTYTESDPFISAMEFVLLADSLYNSTDFGNSSLRLVARHSFGYNGSIIRYPDDQFDRYWEPYGENNPTLSRGENVSINGFWNLPPLKVFQTQFAVSRPEQLLEFQWPLTPLQNSIYYIALYFADDTGTSRVFNITINDVSFYRDLNISMTGVALFANQWRLSGPTKIILSPAPGSTRGPLINGGEIFESGDICRWLGNNRLSGAIPDLSNLKLLKTLHLEDNQLNGRIPSSLGNIDRLQELFLQNNNLTGQVPTSLTLKPGLNLRVAPGNPFLDPPIP
ncbi:Malectin-like carbohydrate-binding domain-containing protein, partial [Cynara cardunculus var. scolymus]